ncbi:hypothetical protein K8B83_04620 [Shewanella inventionis]|uniref:Lipoprotein n=1 Tax=Shewanella inventionis TaxID=1738770 RepID=A0ABQ1JQ96_9GAMM|nr:hypothetical protein [Shewanella inventionis]MCL1159386.1 hypothetical protein [Shewanella inventionis]UAL44141.1 hypothetical protein K8B83_04620 [Shewanella inventionis]GGB72054.1 hypothetical protein GCM10011607_35680 [Shewanella inventionis]
MKITYLSAILASSLLIFGCNSDSDDDDIVVVEPPVVVVPPVVVDPVSEAVDVDEASAITMKLDSFDAASGALTFTLTDADGKAITNATDYDIAYFGYPDPASPSIKPKAWKRWHVTQRFQCDQTDIDNCVGLLQETETEGQYTFDATGLDLGSKAAAGAVEVFKVAVQIHGSNASNDITLIAADE